MLLDLSFAHRAVCASDGMEGGHRDHQLGHGPAQLLEQVEVGLLGVHVYDRNRAHAVENNELDNDPRQSEQKERVDDARQELREAQEPQAARDVQCNSYAVGLARKAAFAHISACARQLGRVVSSARSPDRLRLHLNFHVAGNGMGQGHVAVSYVEHQCKTSDAQVCGIRGQLGVQGHAGAGEPLSQRAADAGTPNVTGAPERASTHIAWLTVHVLKVSPHAYVVNLVCPLGDPIQLFR
mmetsp:Transcript_10319/g.30278  ORF Transcript_10319/g.30278 Transcript_10319/m.30278 type:complete len:239 (-) Transcript_10319:708-1424(-)